VLKQFAKSLHLSVGEQELQNLIRTRYLPPGSNAESALARIRQMGYANVADFESSISGELLIQELGEILQDFSSLSDVEVQEVLKEQGRTFSVERVTVDLAELEKNLLEPSEDDLKSYFEDHASTYEREPSVAYLALPYLPGAYTEAVELQPEDIEVSYSERQLEFRIPDEAKLESLELRINPKADEKEREAVQKEALRLIEKAKSGESLAKLEKEISKGLSLTASYSKPALVQLGQKGVEFDAAVFGSDKTGLLDLVAVPGAYFLVSVSERFMGRIKSLDDVKNQIELELRAQEAPGYALAAGQTDFDEWQKSNEGLSAFVEKKKGQEGDAKAKDSTGNDVVEFASVITQGTLSAKGSDPEGYAGLTAKVLELANGKGKFFVEQGDRVFLVEVTDYRPKEIPGFAEVKDRVKSDYRKVEVRRIARKELENLIGQDSAAQGLSAVTIAGKTFPPQEEKSISLAQGEGVLFEDERVRDNLSKVRKSNIILPEVYEGKESLSVVRVKDVQYPKQEELQKQIAEQRDVVQRAAAQELRAAILANEKSKSEIEVRDWLTKNS
jgi:peptidyl-prolyl cis-trans isomerase D